MSRASLLLALITEERKFYGGVKVSYNPECGWMIPMDLSMDERVMRVEARGAGKVIIRWLASKAGAGYNTYFWDGYVATHQDVAGHIPLPYYLVDSGYLEISGSRWEVKPNDISMPCSSEARAWVQRIVNKK